jgi:hypothetical protein
MDGQRVRHSRLEAVFTAAYTSLERIAPRLYLAHELLSFEADPSHASASNNKRMAIAT